MINWKMLIDLFRKIIGSLYFKIAATLSILIYLYKLVDPRQFAASIEAANFMYLPLLIAVTFVFWSLNVLSLYALLIPLGRLRFREFFNYQLRSTLLGSITPMEAGEAAIFLYLKRNGFMMKKTVAAFLLNKVVHLVMMLLTGLLFLYYMHIPNLVSYLAAAAVLACIFLFLVYTRLRVFVREAVVKRYLSEYYESFEVTSDYFRRYYQYLLLNVAVNAAKIMIAGLFIWINFMMFAIRIDFFLLLSVFNISRIISLIPISLGGIGILEGGVALALSKIGFNYSTIVLAMFFERIISMVLAGIIFPFLYLKKLGGRP